MWTAVAAVGPPFKTRRKCSMGNWGNGKCFGFGFFLVGWCIKKSQMWAYLLKVKDHLIDIFLNGNCCRPIKIIPEDKCRIIPGGGEAVGKRAGKQIFPFYVWWREEKWPSWEFTFSVFHSCKLQESVGGGGKTLLSISSISVVLVSSRGTFGSSRKTARDLERVTDCF